jgi:hypothetical protein
MAGWCLLLFGLDRTPPPRFGDPNMAVSGKIIYANDFFNQKGREMFKFLVAIGLSVAISTGCAVNRATANVDPETRLADLKMMHVKKYPDDNAKVDELIAEKLRTKGVSVTTGAEVPKGIDALVTYVDKWMWDITMYMLELTVVLRNPETDFPLASGNSFHTSLTRLSPKEMVNEVIDNIYKEPAK